MLENCEMSRYNPRECLVSSIKSSSPNSFYKVIDIKLLFIRIIISVPGLGKIKQQFFWGQARASPVQVLTRISSAVKL